MRNPALKGQVIYVVVDGAFEPLAVYHESQTEADLQALIDVKWKGKAKVMAQVTSFQRDQTKGLQ